MFSRLIPSNRAGVAATLLAGVAVALCPARADSPANPHRSAPQGAMGQDDGWRRTAQGWEQIVGPKGVLQPGFELAKAPMPRATREQPGPFPQLTIHPLLLAALEMLLVITAYQIFPTLGTNSEIMA